MTTEWEQKRVNVQTAVTHSIYEGFYGLSLARDETVPNIAHSLLYPTGYTTDLIDLFSKIEPADKIEPHHRKTMSFPIFNRDFHNLDIIARHRNTSKERIFTSIFAGYLATDEARTEIRAAFLAEAERYKKLSLKY